MQGHISLPSLASFIARTYGGCAAMSSRESKSVSLDGWDIRGRWYGVVVVATVRLGELRRGETIPWRVIAAQIAASERRGSS
jgi:hypothetical protein